MVKKLWDLFKKFWDNQTSLLNGNSNKSSVAANTDSDVSIVLKWGKLIFNYHKKRKERISDKSPGTKKNDGNESTTR